MLRWTDCKCPLLTFSTPPPAPDLLTRLREMLESSAHADLDAALAAAYGWPANLDNAAILERLLALNLQRTLRQAQEG